MQPDLNFAFLSPMRSATIIPVLFAIAALSPPAALTQPAAIAPGDRIRITMVYSTRIAGTLVRTSSDSLVLATADKEAGVPLHIVRRLDVSTGQKPNTRKGAMIGFAIGGLAVGLAGFAAGAQDPCRDAQGLCFDFIGPGDGFVVGAVVGGLIGGGIGAVIGSMSHSDHWKRVSIETSLGQMRTYPSGTDFYRLAAEGQLQLRTITLK